MAVLVDDQVIEGSAGVVNLRTGVEVTSDSLFTIQSITKVRTATLIMQLVDDGAVELDAPVRTYMPAFGTADDRAGEKITVRHLLTHTGGFEGDIWTETTASDDALQAFVDDCVSCAPQYAQPGEMYSYCSAGYGVLGRIVEVLRAMPYAQAVRRYLTGPLGIDEVAFNANEALAYRTAIGHARPYPAADQQPLHVWAVMPPSNPAAGNQLAMSARGLIGFARMHVSDGRAADGTQVLSAASAALMRDHQLDLPAAMGGRSLGWMLPNRPGIVEHGGGAIGVASTLLLVPAAGVAVAVLTNGGDAGRLVADLIEPLIDGLTDVAPAPPLPGPAHDPVVLDPARYIGRYQSRPTVVDVTSDDDGRLWLDMSGGNEQLTMAELAGVTVEPKRNRLWPVGGDLFVFTDSSGAPVRAIEFLGTDAAGRARFVFEGRAVPRVD